jgi:hypothetical protein
MIVIRVELWSAVNGQVSELARMTIDNIGATANGQHADYRARSFRGRDAATLHRAMLAGTVQREGKVIRHARLRLHVWHLVARALDTLGYAERRS